VPSQRHPAPPAPRAPGSTAVSDRDRDRCVERLREHCGEGRLTPEELEERIDLALAARTKRDLRRATAGLPPAPVVPRGTLRRVHRTLLGVHATAYTAGNGSAVALWAATGEGLFWPAILLVPWTAVLGAHAASGPIARRAWRAVSPGAAGRRARGR
jgi:hypothetical protein